MKWFIRGLWRSDGTAGTMTLDAGDAAAAEKLASERGLLAEFTTADDHLGAASPDEIPKYRYLDVEGEGPHQAALEAFAGGRTAQKCDKVVDAELILAVAPGNKKQVWVAIAGHVVGRLAGKDATAFRKRMKVKGAMVERTPCKAKIIGGWDHGPDDQGMFGVIAMLPV